MPEISVVVPVYKVERYLPQCIESLLAQTFRDIEIILVDDGSPDNSGAICDEYAERDERIVVLHKENGGVSSARNMGLDHARGKYIMFCDSDDTVDETWIQKLYELMEEKDTALAVCYYLFAFDDGKVKKLKNISESTYFSTQDFWKLHIVHISISVCNKMFCKDVIDKYNLRFEKEYSFAEDGVFSLGYIKLIRGRFIGVCQEPLYRYRCDVTESLTKKYHSNMWEAQMRLMSLVRENLCDENGCFFSEQGEKQYFIEIINSISNCINNILSVKSDLKIGEKIREGQKLLNKPVCKEAFAKGEFIDFHPWYIKILKTRSFLLVYLFHAAVKFKHLIFKD